MWKSILSIIILGAILWAGIVFLLPKIAPDFSRQGKQVLINGLDTATIVSDEKPLPNWSWIPKRPLRVRVRYKDKVGIYHEEEFSSNEITEVENQN